jgi:hypothetical protein
MYRVHDPQGGTADLPTVCYPGFPVETERRTLGIRPARQNKYRPAQFS